MEDTISTIAKAIAIANGHPDPEAYAARVLRAHKGEPLEIPEPPAPTESTEVTAPVVS